MLQSVLTEHWCTHTHTHPHTGFSFFQIVYEVFESDECVCTAKGTLACEVLLPWLFALTFKAKMGIL